jgi:hypothetical protein
MAIGARTATTASSAGATSVAPSKPTGLADNDVVYIAVSIAGGTGIGTAPNVSGFTQVGTRDNSTTIRAVLLRKVITSAAGEPSTYSVSWDGVSRAVGVVCQAYTGVDTTTPEDATAVVNSGAGTTINSATNGVTTVTANAWLLYVGTLSGSSTTIPAPTSFTEDGQTSGSRVELSHLLQAAAGSSGTISSGNLGSSKTWASLLTALRPAGAGGTVYTSSPSGSLATAGTLNKATARGLTGTLTTAGAALRAITRLLTGTLATAGALTKQTARLLVGALATAGTVSKQATRLLSGTLTSAGTLTRAMTRTLVSSLATAGALTRSMTRTLTGALATAGTVTGIRTFLRRQARWAAKQRGHWAGHSRRWAS